MSKTQENATQNSDAVALRKKLDSVNKRAVKVNEERIKLTRELEVMEHACPHKWSKPTPVKGSEDRYEKTCEICLKKEISKNVKVIF